LGLTQGTRNALRFEERFLIVGFLFQVRTGLDALVPAHFSGILLLGVPGLNRCQLIQRYNLTLRKTSRRLP